MTLAIISFSILFAYAVLIINFIKGWTVISDYQPEKQEVEFPVTIITPCKNEIEHLPHLFRAVSEQFYHHYEFILVDDCSTDGSMEFAKEVATGFPQLKVLSNNGNGKKEAIKTAVEHADSRLIITLDADCIPQPEWLETIVHFYDKEFTDMIICPVKFTSDGSFFQEFLQFEFASLVGSGAGAAGLGTPILCNGANLAFRRQMWLKNVDSLRFEEKSGDDIFLLQSIKRQGGNIRFLKSKAAMVETAPVTSLKDFLRQRQRWAGKRAAYRDWHLAGTASIVFLASFTILFNLAYALANPLWFPLVGWLFVMKWMIDLSFFMRIRDFFDLKNVVRNSLLISLIYPFYIITTAFLSFFGRRNEKW